MFFQKLSLILVCFLLPTPLFASAGGIPGETLSLWWALPFFGMLVSLAFMPLFALIFGKFTMEKWLYLSKAT